MSSITCILLPYMEVAPSPEDIEEAVPKGIAVGIDRILT